MRRSAKASNMMSMSWSATLAWQAQHVMDEKIGDTLTSTSRFSSSICGDDCAWQNVAATTSVQSLIDAWSAEGSASTRWSQMMYASHDKVGCAKKLANGRSLLICYYYVNPDSGSFSGNWIAGAACSKCSTTTSYSCDSNALCYRPNSTPALAGKRVLIFHLPSGSSGVGSNLDDTPMTVSTGIMLETWGMSVSITNVASEVASQLSSGYRPDMFLQPGSNHDISFISKVIGVVKAPIQNYVASGGTYMGICWGAFAAADLYYNLLPNMRPTNMGFQETANTNDQQPTVVMPYAQPPGGRVYYSEGPILTPTWDTKVTYGSYKTDAGNDASLRGTPLAAKSRYGRGRVGLISPHFEAGPDW